MTNWTPLTKNTGDISLVEGTPMGLLLALTYSITQIVPGLIWGVPDKNTTPTWSATGNKTSTNWGLDDKSATPSWSATGNKTTTNWSFLDKN